LGRVSQKNLLPKVLGKDRRNLRPLSQSHYTTFVQLAR
jgi:hypothetical protein